MQIFIHAITMYKFYVITHFLTVNPTSSLENVVPGHHNVLSIQALTIRLLICLGLFTIVLSLLVRFSRSRLFRPINKSTCKNSIIIKETKSLGNKQFLTVVYYNGKKIMLGITSNNIQYLCDLPLENQAQSLYVEVNKPF